MCIQPKYRQWSTSNYGLILIDHRITTNHSECVQCVKMNGKASPYPTKQGTHDEHKLGAAYLLNNCSLVDTKWNWTQRCRMQNKQLLSCAF